VNLEWGTTRRIWYLNYPPYENHVGWGTLSSVNTRSDRNVRATQASFIRANQPTLKPEPKGSGFFMR